MAQKASTLFKDVEFVLFLVSNPIIVDSESAVVSGHLTY